MRKFAINYPTILCLSITLSLLSGCGSTPNKSVPISTDKAVKTNPDNVDKFLSIADNSIGTRALELRLEAASLALKNQNIDQAKAILLSINSIDDKQVSKSNARTYAFIQVQVALALKNGDLAMQWLRDKRIDASPLTETYQIQLGKLRAEVFQLKRSFLASARERIFFDALLSNPEKQINHDAIFTSLLEIPANILTIQAQKAITSNLRGWLSLAAMTKQNQSNPLQQLRELQRWNTVWASHPASRLLPSNLQNLHQIVESQAKSIAILLPLQGKLGIYGRAIRDGIIAARFESRSKVSLKIYDTSNNDILAIADRAKREGAEMIIGPLDRTNVDTLVSNVDLSLPILTLNRASTSNHNPNLFQFGLAPEDEMVQVADQVFSEGKRNVLALYPDTAWGTRNFQAFNKRWSSLGGNVVATAAYKNQKDYSKLIKRVLNVDKSEARAKNLRRIMGNHFEFTPRRRQDVDFIFLLGNQSQARGINPTLAFYYAEDIPVYSTSHINEYTESRVESIDLNGIRFCDIPWKLTQTDTLQQKMDVLWQKKQSILTPFYALGADAFRLVPRLQQLKSNPATKIYGATGILTLDKENILKRHLLWAQYAKGQIITSPRVTTL